MSLGSIARGDRKHWPQTWWLPLLLVFVALALGVSAAFISPQVLVGGVALIVAIALVLLNFESALLVILVIRPFLEMEFFQNYSFYRTTTNVGLDAAAAANLLIAFVGILYIWIHKINVSKSLVSRTFIAFIYICIVSTIFSSDRMLTLAQTIIVISYFALFVVLASVIRTRKQVNRLLMVYLLSAVAPTVTAIYQALTSESTYGATGMPRVSGILTTWASLGEFMILPLTVALMLCLRSNSLAKRVGYGILFLIFAVPFFFSFTRTTWAGFVLIAFILAVFRYRALLVLIPVVLVVVWVAVPSVSLRFSDLSLQNPDASTLGVRLRLWRAAIDLFESSPLVGVGFGIADKRVGFMAFGKNVPVHNTYLRVLADLGLVGFIAYLGLQLSFLGDAIFSYKNVRSLLYRTLVVGFIAVWAATLWQQFWGNHLTTSIRQFYFWSFAALSYALVRVEREDGLPIGNVGKEVARGLGIS